MTVVGDCLPHPSAASSAESCRKRCTDVDDFIDLINATLWSHYDLQRAKGWPDRSASLRTRPRITENKNGTCIMELLFS